MFLSLPPFFSSFPFLLPFIGFIADNFLPNHWIAYRLWVLFTTQRKEEAEEVEEKEEENLFWS
jgi:hypothetical protein